MTLSEILDEVLRESGVSTETAYATSTDDAVLRMVSLANRSIQTLARYPWQALRKVWTLTLSADTSYTLPSDWRAPIADTLFSDSHVYPVAFPADEAEWSYLQASSGGTGESIKARLIGNTLQIIEPDSGSTLLMEYLANTPVYSSAAARKEKFTADDDYPVLDSDLVTQDILWRYKKLMGQEWQPDLMECKMLERTLRGQEAGSQTIRPGYSLDADTPYYNLWRPSSEAV
jgi:hypothetical protein